MMPGRNLILISADALWRACAHRFFLSLMLTLVLAACCWSGAAADESPDYVADVRFALDELEKKCGHFFELKGIDWKKVSKQFLKEAKAVKTDQDHLVLLVRLLARVRDGHAGVRPLETGQGVKWPDDGRGQLTGPGFFLCRVGKKIFVKSSWSSAKSSGLLPGMEVVKVEGKPALKWLEALKEDNCDTRSFSTDHQAFFHTCHWGLAKPAGTRLQMEIKDLKNKKKKRTVTYTKASTVPWGPAFFLKGTEGGKDVRWCTLPSGYGYIHLRRCPGNLPELVDEALAAFGDVPGLILDFRANGGGGFDHDGFMGRFVPEGKTLTFAKSYKSAGPKQYGGPIVVIVDAITRSAGETASGIFKEDGRGYMIGESPTAGMSSSKTTIELPSRLFSLYVSVHSNKARFQGGKGIEGVGVIPHETVEYDPKDLAKERDTLIEYAEKLLGKFPKKKVPYDPAKFGWKGK